MSLDDLAWLSYVRIESVSGNQVILTTENYRSLLKHEHENDIRQDDDKNPDPGRLFVGAGLGFNSATLVGGWLF